MATLKLQSNGPLYSNIVIGTLAVDGWAVTSCPVPLLAVRPLYQLHIIRCDTIVTSALYRVNS